MADKKTLAMDSKGLQSFIDNELADFLKDLDDIQKDSPSGVRALKSLVDGRPTPETLQATSMLVIGPMNSDGSPVHGKDLVTHVTDNATSLVDILTGQKTLFTDVDRDLRETVKTLLKTQGDNLASIDGEKFLDIFSDVDGDMSAGGSSTDK